MLVCWCLHLRSGAGWDVVGWGCAGLVFPDRSLHPGCFEVKKVCQPIAIAARWCARGREGGRESKNKRNWESVAVLCYRDGGRKGGRGLACALASGLLAPLSSH